MSLVDTYLVDGTDLNSYNQGKGVTDFSTAFETAPRRGQNYVLPGSNGATYVAKPLDVLPLPIGVTITGVDPATGLLPATEQLRTAQMVANWRALVTLVKAESGGTVTLTRKLSTLAGSSVSETCTAEVVGGIQATVLSNSVVRLVINFANLSGTWA